MIHEQLSLQGIFEFTFLPKAFVITKKIEMNLLASNHHKSHDFCIFVKVGQIARKECKFNYKSNLQPMR